MNERIENLAKDCFEYIEGTIDGDTIEFNYKKFAELIILDCVKSLQEEADYYANPGSYEPEEYYTKCAAKVIACEDAISKIKYIFDVK